MSIADNQVIVDTGAGMSVRGRKLLAGLTVASAVTLVGTMPASADVVQFAEDLPDGTAASPAASTPSATTAVVNSLGSHDVDAFQICITDPAAFHLTVEGVSDTGATRTMDTVVWLFDASGFLVASNDDASSGGTLGSAIDPGAVAASEPGAYTVAVSHYRTNPRRADSVVISQPGAGPLDHWTTTTGANHGLFRADLVAGATGSDGCGGEPVTDTPGDSHAVTTGNGRCQVLGGEGAARGRAQGLERAAEKRQSATC